MTVKSISQKQNMTVGLCWKNGLDRSVKSASDKQTEIISAGNVSGNLTENSIPLQKDSNNDQTAIEDMEVPTATPSSDEGPRMSKRKKKPPTTKSEDFLW